MQNTAKVFNINTQEATSGDLIDFITSMQFESETNPDHPGNKLVKQLEKTKSAAELMEWFHQQKRPSDGIPYIGITEEDCQKLLDNKENMLKYGKLLTTMDAY